MSKGRKNGLFVCKYIQFIDKIHQNKKITDMICFLQTLLPLQDTLNSKYDDGQTNFFKEINHFCCRFKFDTAYE